MKTKFTCLFIAVVSLMSVYSVTAQNTAFTYQGRVTDNGTNFNGSGQFQFALVTSTNANSTATATANAPSGGYITGYNLISAGNGYSGSTAAMTITGGGGSGAAAHANISGGAVTSITVDNPGNGNYSNAPTVMIAPPPPNISYTTYWSNDGTSVAGSQPSSAVNVAVSNGLFTVVLGDTTLANMTAIDASLFAQPDLQLRIWFNDGVNGFAALSPVQDLTPTPYAIAAMSANSASNLLGTLPVAQLSGTIPASQLPSAVVTNNETSLNLSGGFSGNFSGNGGGLTNVSGALPWQMVSGTAQQAQPNVGYLLTNNSLVTVTLPTSPNIGDITRVSSTGTGGWKIAQNAGQFVSSANLVGNIGPVWAPHGTNQNWESIASSSDGTKLVAGVYGGQIYTSTDSGASWTARDSSRIWYSVASSADGTKLVAGVYGGQIYTSTDSGVTWTARDSNRYWYSVASSSDGTKLVAVVNGGQIYTSTDSGASWTARDSNRGWYSVASSADGTKLVAGVVGGQIYTSTDSGASWTARDSNRNWYSVASSSDGTKLVAGVNGGQIYTSTDSGRTWTARDSNRNWYSVASSSDGTKLVAGVNGGQIYTSVPSSVSSTTSGATGYLLGNQNSAVELQYLGNGQFLPIGHEGIIQAF
jgi:hypothetical protein